MKLDLDRTESGRSQLDIAGEVHLQLGEGCPERVTVAGTVTVDNLESRFLLNGTLSAEGEFECGRCLSAFKLTWPVPVEIMVLRDLESDEGEGDTLVLLQKAGEVDLQTAIGECVALAIPLAPVCAEDCRGLCAQCGANLNEETCTCAEDDYDPRWEGLP